MGIQGLHKGLNFATKKTTLRDFAGNSLAVDSSSWLHRSVYSVAEKYVEGIEHDHIDRQCVMVAANYVTSRCRELLDAFGITKIFLVMDGKRCPLKADTNAERERRRQANLVEARAYLRRGRKDKAEEKYKTCIKIKDEFTHAVMAEVQKKFSKDARVQLVWSPYEADAQLAKLCVDGAAQAVITEDSDVLVYSAASHCAFPIIFKLDRQTGTCDVISMDWLLSYDEAKAPPSPKATSALETLLRNLAARQSRRPGLGVRLFVQGCVLAGCDYAPNKLTGVGLVNAFKHIRDNAFRNDSVRFAKVLEAIPRKHKLNIDTSQYEMILAKSEAVFYYHLVRYPNKSVKPLCEPQRLEPEKDAPHCFKHHSPQMARFGEDWSFLGESQQHNNQRPGNESPPLKEIVICDSKFKPKNKGMVDRKATGSLPAMFATGKRTTPTRNPYVKTQSTLETRKRPRNDGKLPLDNLDPNQERLGNNFFSKFARDCKLEKNLDPRFVKRRFSTLDKNLLSPQVTANESGQAQICKDKKSTPFEYDIANTNIVNKILPIEPDTPGLTGEQWRDPFIDDGVEVLFDSSVDAPTFFDLTDSNSEPFPINLDGVEDDDEAISKIKPARVSLDDTVDLRRNLLSPDLEAEYDFQLPEPSPNLRKDRLRDFDVNNLSKTSRQVSSRSRYFATSQSNRLTNDLVQDETIIRGDSISPKMQHSKLEYDDIIESPNDSKQHFTNLYSGRSTGIKPTRLSSSFPKLMNASTETTPGPSLNAFKKQEKQCYTSTSLSHARPWVRSFRPSQKRQCSPKNGAATVTLKSYFPSVKQPSTDFNQLQYNTNPTDEDFLWNDS